MYDMLKYETMAISWPASLTIGFFTAYSAEEVKSKAVLSTASENSNNIV